MLDKIVTHAARFHLDKATQLRKEWETRKVAGERRIWRMEEELKEELNRLDEQAKLHESQANGMMRHLTK